MKKTLLLTCALFALAAPAQARDIWSKAEANAWYGKQKWLVGSNYIPADAINQLEMWQAESFNPAQIDKELGWAQAMGMTTMRVFLHDALWQQDAPGFKKRIDTFLTIAARHGIKPLFVLFDSCWALLAARLRFLLKGRGRLRSRITAGCYIGAGLGLALARKP